MTVTIKRENIGAILNAGELYAAMKNGRWWRLRRNGKTQYWKRDTSRIRVPVKAGLRSHYAITESDFRPDGSLDPDSFRHVNDVPAELRS